MMRPQSWASSGLPRRSVARALAVASRLVSVSVTVISIPAVQALFPNAFGRDPGLASYLLFRMVSNRGAVSPLSMSAGASLSESRPPLPQDRQRNAALSRFTSRGLELQPACTERDQSAGYRGFESRLPLSMMTAAPKRRGAFSDLRGYKARIQPRRASAPVARC